MSKKSEKTATTKITKKTAAPVEAAREAKATAAPEAKRTRAAKPTKEKAPKEELVVFAIRLTQAERDAIHAAAGPARATRYIRAVAGAFAAGDETAFKALVKEAREAQN